MVDLMPWECFQDPSYYDMWCVRQVDKRTWGEGFHLINGDEAAALRDMLNTRTPPAAQADDAALVEELARALWQDDVRESGVIINGKQPEWNRKAHINHARAILPILHRERAAAHAAGRAAERAEVVAWLRSEIDLEWTLTYDALLIGNFTDAIERGQHGSKGDE
jgi:hypothetical protein